MTMTGTDIERDAAKLLISEGIKVKVGKREYHIKEATLGMLDEISAIRLKATADEKLIKENPIAATNKTVHENAYRMAKIVAIGILGAGRIKRRLLAGLLAWWLMERLKPSALFEMIESITYLSNPADFMNSIRLAGGIRMTAPLPDPNLVETTSKAPGANEATS